MLELISFLGQTSPFKKVVIIIIYALLGINSSLFSQNHLDEKAIWDLINQNKKYMYKGFEVNFNQNNIKPLLAIYDKISNPQQKGEAAFVIGNFYAELYDYTEAVIKLKEAVDLFESIGDWGNYLFAIKDYCSVKRMLNDIDDIEQILLEAIEFSKINKVGFLKLKPIQELAIHYSYTLGEYKKAVIHGENFLDLLAKYKRQDIKDEDFDVIKGLDTQILYLELGHAYLELGNYDKAHEYLVQSMNYFEKLNDYEKLRRIYKHRIKLEIYSKQIDSVVYFYSKLHDVSNKHRRIGVAVIKKAPQYLFELTSLERALKNDQVKSSRLTNHFLILLSAILFILFILSLSLIYSKKVRKAQNQLNTALTKQYENLERLSKEKTKYFAILSHELRTPILAITGLTNLLKDNDKSYKEYIRAIINSSDHLLQLVNNVLQLNKLESADKIFLQRETFNIVETLKDVERTISYFAKQKKVKTSVKYNFPKETLAIGDKQKITQILINLASNAIKHSYYYGEVEINVEEITKNLESPVYSFSVVDHGHGLSEAQIKEVFNYETTNKVSINNELVNFESIGIGLYIVSKFLTAMNSRIAVTSMPDIKTEFKFKLALEKGHLTESENTLLPSKIKGLKVLVIDDSKVNLMVTQKSLKHQGIKSFTATEKDSHIDIIKKEEIDLVLMDLNMPVNDGYNCTKTIRDAGITIPIIAHTAIIEEEIDITKLHQYGLQDYIVKPYEMKKLHSILIKYFKPEPQLS